ncbi:hypothetical protein GGF31_001945 [Allomyces arbusculus]|nr:hypothetical protein GGF31_001945 [Allomyces arbusculus]
MCGRIALNVNAAQVRRQTGLRHWVGESKFAPTTNVAPTTFQPVVVHRGGAAECGARSGEEYVVAMAHGQTAGVAERLAEEVNEHDTAVEKGNGRPTTAADSAESKIDGDEHALFDPSEQDAYALFSMKWGLLTASSGTTGLAPINARDDSLTSGKPMFAGLRHRHRCMVVAQGFYEWVRKGTKKTPYYVRRADKRLLCMAGLYAAVPDPAHPGSTLHSFTIVTTENTPKLAFLHDRMPVLLTTPRAIRAWLDPNTRWGPALEAVMHEGRNDDGLVWYAVDPRVGKAGVHDPNFVEPYTPKPTGLMAMWGGTGTAQGVKRQREVEVEGEDGGREGKRHATEPDEESSVRKEKSTDRPRSPDTVQARNQDMVESGALASSSAHSAGQRVGSAAVDPSRARRPISPREKERIDAAVAAWDAGEESDGVVVVVEYE